MPLIPKKPSICREYLKAMCLALSCFYYIYTQPLSKAIGVKVTSFHLYADDRRLYIAFIEKCASSITKMRNVTLYLKYQLSSSNLIVKR